MPIRKNQQGSVPFPQRSGSASLVFLTSAQLIEIQAKAAERPTPYYQPSASSSPSKNTLKKWRIEDDIAHLSLSEFYDLFIDTRNIQQLCLGCQKIEISDGQFVIAKMSLVKEGHLDGAPHIPHVYASKLRKQGLGAVFASVADRVIVTSGKTVYGVLSRTLPEPNPTT